MPLVGQKDIVHLKNTTRVFTKPGALVSNKCLGTGATMKASLSKRKHRTFTGCDKNSGCLWGMKPPLLHVFTSQLLNLASDLNGGERLGSAAQSSLACRK